METVCESIAKMPSGTRFWSTPVSGAECGRSLSALLEYGEVLTCARPYPGVGT
jgi:hypothetical protein